MEMKKLVKLEREPKKGYGEDECPICGKLFTKLSPNALHCEECRPIARGKTTKNQQAQRVRGMRLQDGSLPNDLPPSRTCHDCGRPTNNYRCAECWAKIQHGLNSDIASEEYSISYTTHSRS